MVDDSRMIAFGCVGAAAAMATAAYKAFKTFKESAVLVPGSLPRVVVLPSVPDHRPEGNGVPALEK